MTNSIIDNEKRCILCGTTRDLHRHHIYGGSRRNASEKYGMWVYLCARHHNMSDDGIHFNKAFDEIVKIAGQMAWEKEIGTREEFMKVFGRNYL